MLYYSADTKGFYDSEIHTIMPDDAVEITQEEYVSLLEGQTEGMEIIPDSNGHPAHKYPDEPPSELTVEMLRSMLRNTDYKALPDYQATKTAEENQANMAQRAEWREQLRLFQSTAP